MSNAAEWVPVTRLQPWDKNPRKSQPVREVANSIKRLGWGAVLLAREDGTLVAGHTRLLAYELLSAEWKTTSEKQRLAWHPDARKSAEDKVVPVRFGNWSERDAALLAIADNRLNEKAEWDMPGLQDILSSFDMEDVGLTGFDQSDLEKMADTLLDNNDIEPQLEGLVFSVAVECDDENHQIEVMTILEERGLKCRPLIS